MRKMKRFGLILCLAALLVGFSQNVFASEELLQTVIPMIAEFSENENTVELPVSDMYVLCGKERNSDLMIDDVIVAVYDDKREWTWNAYWAGEWTIFRIGELNALCTTLYNNRDKLKTRVSNLPVDLDKYEALSRRNGNSTSLVGIDSAYMHGDIQSAAGKGHWEAYPFLIVESDDSIFEQAAYLNFRIVIPIDDQTDQIQDFIIASQEKVGEVFKKMLELNPDINAKDRETMNIFVEYAEILKKMKGLSSRKEAAPVTNQKKDPVKFTSGDFEALDYGNDTCEITKYFGKASNLTIPQRLNGLTVIGINEGAFKECGEIEKVTMPDTVTRIADEAFYHCEKLQTVVLNNGLKSIGDRSFYWCDQLSSVEIPEGVLSLGLQAFDGCEKLKEINIPDSLTSISSTAFPRGYNFSIEKIRISERHPVFEFRKGLLIERSSMKLISYYGKDTIVQIPEGVTEISVYAFSECDSVEEIIIPDSVKTMNEYSFVDCSSLKKISIPDSVTEIENRLFAGYAPETVVISNQHPVLKFENGCLINKKNHMLVSYHGPQKDVVIPAGVEEIQERAFTLGHHIQSIVIPEGIKTIGSYAFMNQDELIDVTLPDSLKTIEDGAFAYCYDLESIVIPGGVTDIGNRAFASCNDLKQITILNKNAVIEDDVFEGSRNLKTIYGYPGSTAEKYGQAYGIDFVPIGMSAASKPAAKKASPTSTPKPAATKVPLDSMPKPEATKIPLPYKALKAKKSVSGDYEYADMGDGTCVITDWGGTKQNLKIPQKLNGKKVVGIGYEAFTEYDRDEILTSVTIPDGVTVLGAHAFVSCSRLKQITIPDSVTTIEEGAFNSCGDLESVTIPKNVTFVGNAAFSGCWSLNSVTVYSENVVFEEGWNGENPFSGCKQLTEIRGISGSSAEKLAKDLGVRFVALPKQNKEMARNGNSNSTRTEYKKGDSGNEVLRIKKRLQELGYYSADAKLSDEFNDTMVSRVKRYQRDERLKQTGKVDLDTYRSLMLAN